MIFSEKNNRKQQQQQTNNNNQQQIVANLSSICIQLFTLIGVLLVVLYLVDFVHKQMTNLFSRILSSASSGASDQGGQRRRSSAAATASRQQQLPGGSGAGGSSAGNSNLTSQQQYSSSTLCLPNSADLSLLSTSSSGGHNRQQQQQQPQLKQQARSSIHSLFSALTGSSSSYSTATTTTTNNNNNGNFTLLAPLECNPSWSRCRSRLFAWLTFSFLAAKTWNNSGVNSIGRLDDTDNNIQMSLASTTSQSGPFSGGFVCLRFAGFTGDGAKSISRLLNLPPLLSYFSPVRQLI